MTRQRLDPTVHIPSARAASVSADSRPRSAVPELWSLRRLHLTALAVHSLALVAAAALLAGCADEAPVAPHRQSEGAAALTAGRAADVKSPLATLRRVTARYHDLKVATGEGFVLLHECESRPGEGPVGTVYVHPGRLMDGVIDPATPDALIYEPGRYGRRPNLVGVEFAIPYSLWTGREPPKFLGATFQREDEFGVFALHAWVWRTNPLGMFEETNPSVSCGVE
jgi:hypothetical protein